MGEGSGEHTLRLPGLNPSGPAVSQRSTSPRKPVSPPPLCALKNRCSAKTDSTSEDAAFASSRYGRSSAVLEMLAFTIERFSGVLAFLGRAADPLLRRNIRLVEHVGQLRNVEHVISGIISPPNTHGEHQCTSQLPSDSSSAYSTGKFRRLHSRMRQSFVALIFWLVLPSLKRLRFAQLFQPNAELADPARQSRARKL